MLVLVDYDDTILVNGSIDKDMIEYLREVQRSGGKVVLWTVREGWRLQEAVLTCRACGLEFDDIAVGKPLADLYIDDKAMRPGEVVLRKKRGGISRQRLTSLRRQGHEEA